MCIAPLVAACAIDQSDAAEIELDIDDPIELDGELVPPDELVSRVDQADYSTDWVQGTATMYGGGNGGACLFGPVSPRPIVAVGSAMYPEVCGGCVEIQGSHGTVVAEVVDQCPECAPDRLDLSVSAWQTVTQQFPSIIDIDWRRAPCDTNDNVLVDVTVGSSAWFMELIVRQSRYAVSQVQTRSAGTNAWINASRHWSNKWTVNGTPVTTPLSVRLIDERGEIITAHDLIDAAYEYGAYDFGAQFPW